MPEANKRNILSDIFHFLTSNVFAAIIGIASSIILTRLLGPQNKGIYTFALVIPQIIIGFSLFGIRQSVIVGIGGKKYSNHEMISALFFLFLYTSAIGIILCSAFFFSGNTYTTDISTYAIILILCLIPVRIANNYLNSFYLGKSHFKIINRTKWINAILFLAGIIILVYLIKLSVTGAFLSLMLTAVITFLILFLLLFRHKYLDFSAGKLTLNTAHIKQLVSLGVLYAIAFVIIQLNLRADVILIKYFKGNETIGFYAIAVALAESLWQFPAAVGTVLISRTANSEDISKTLQDTNFVSRITLIIALIAGILIFFLSPYLIPLVYGKNFIPSIVIVQTIIPGIIFFSVMRVIISFIAGIAKPWTIIMIGLPALLINIFFNMFTIPLWGGTGAAIATDISYFTAFVITIIYYVRKFKVDLHELLIIKKDDIHLLNKFMRSFFQKRRIY